MTTFTRTVSFTGDDGRTRFRQEHRHMGDHMVRPLRYAAKAFFLNPAMFSSVISICVGASAGALLRWFLALRFNPSSAALPLGTLAANLIGG